MFGMHKLTNISNIYLHRYRAGLKDTRTWCVTLIPDISLYIQYLILNLNKHCA